MKKILLLLVMTFCLTSYAQTKTNVIIPINNTIKKYHEMDELKRMQKGQLMNLYLERIKVLMNTLPYIAMTTTEGISFQDLGIPPTDENVEALKIQQEITKNFTLSSSQFQKQVTPYSDKNNLILSILFYEETLKNVKLLYER